MKKSILILIGLCSALIIQSSCSGVQKLGDGLSFNESYLVKERKGRSAKKNIEKGIKKGPSSHELMALSRTLGSFLAMYEFTDSLKYLQMGYKLTNEVVGRARVSRDIAGNRSRFKDKYLTWVNLNPKYEETQRGAKDMMEYPLFESYFYRYMAKMLYLTFKLPASKEKEALTDDYETLLNFIKINGWEKWYERGKLRGDCYKYIFRSRTHMTSHWALTALFLSEMVSDQERLNQYQNIINLYNRQLRLNLVKTSNNAYIWNATWDNSWPLDLECNSPPKKSIVQDASHGNHVITYVVEAHELNNSWTKKDIKYFSNTALKLLFNSQDSSFYADLNKSVNNSVKNGIRLGDGFLKLARYNKDLLYAFESAREANTRYYKFRYDEIQYVAEFKLAQKYLSR